MIALSIALAYLASLVFVAWVVEFRARHQKTIGDRIDALDKALAAVRARSPAWDEATEFLENEKIRRGVTTRRAGG